MIDLPNKKKKPLSKSFDNEDSLYSSFLNKLSDDDSLFSSLTDKLKMSNDSLYHEAEKAGISFRPKNKIDNRTWGQKLNENIDELGKEDGLFPLSPKRDKYDEYGIIWLNKFIANNMVNGIGKGIGSLASVGQEAYERLTNSHKKGIHENNFEDYLNIGSGALDALTLGKTSTVKSTAKNIFSNPTVKKSVLATIGVTLGNDAEGKSKSEIEDNKTKQLKKRLAETNKKISNNYLNLYLNPSNIYRYEGINKAIEYQNELLRSRNLLSSLINR